MVSVSETCGGNGGAVSIKIRHVQIFTVFRHLFFKIQNLTLNFELMIDCILAVFILDGASVLAGVFTCNFANKKRSFGH